MTRRLKSLAVRFPLLISAIVLLVALATTRMVEREIGAELIRKRGAELSAGAARVATMLATGMPALRRQPDSVTARPQYRRALLGNSDTAAVSRIIAEVASESRDTTRVLTQLLGPAGEVRGEHPMRQAPEPFTWPSGAATAGTLSRDSLTLSPILELGNSLAGFAVVTPIREGPDRHLGWIVEVRKIQSRGVEDVRALIGVETMLLGQPDAGVWTDLVRVAAPPAPVSAVDSVRRVTTVARGDAVGIAKRVVGTPWVVWVESPTAEVLAPVNALFARLWPVVGLIGLLGALVAWLLARVAGRRIRAVASEIDQTLTAHGAVAPANATDEFETLERSYARLSERVEGQRRLETQFLQSQKLEAVGRLAGGVAHDFNNLLTVVSNFGELVREKLPEGSQEAADMHEVLHAANRAAALTRQLLAFSRQHLVDPLPLDLNAVITSADRMLTRMIPSNVERTLSLGSDIPVVTADEVHLEQVLMNLVLNAVDSMPNGGRLVIRTTCEELSPTAGALGELPGGTHACIAVSDTGAGMDAETLARVFDPFFTTKVVGKGTGLGLATVHGIVGQANGRIWAYSEPGHGTTMKVYLPATEGAATVSSRVGVRERARTPAEGLVLVVEDDPGTLAVTSRQLSRQGFTVREFVRADLALEWLGRGHNAASVRAVISDVMMPGMSGVEFIRRAGELWPTLPFVLMSGYAGPGDELAALSCRRPTLLDKPFTVAALLDAVDDALGKRRVSSAGSPP